MKTARYRKPRSLKKGALATAGTLLAAGSASVVGVVGYYAATEGWRFIVDWFSGKWFCLIAVIALLAGTLAFFAYLAVRNFIRSGGDANE